MLHKVLPRVQRWAQYSSYFQGTHTRKRHGSQWLVQGRPWEVPQQRYKSRVWGFVLNPHWRGLKNHICLGISGNILWGTSHCRLSIYDDRDWGVGGTNTRSKARPGREPRPVWAGLGWGRVSRKYGQHKSFLVGPSHNAKTIPLKHSILLFLPIMHPETLPKSQFFQGALTFHPTPISTYHNYFNMWATLYLLSGHFLEVCDFHRPLQWLKPGLLLPPFSLFYCLNSVLRVVFLPLGT